LQMEWVAGNVLRRGLLRIDERTPDAGIFLGDELDGNLAEVRITVVGVAVGISQFHRLHNGMNIVGGVVAHRLEVKSLQEVEVLEKNRRLAPEADLVNLDASISSLERLFNPRVVGCEVSFAQQATRLLAEIADPLCNGPAVKVVPDGFQGGHTSLSGVLPLDLRQTLEGPRKIGLNEEFTGLRRMSPRLINSHCGGPLLPHRLSASHSPRQTVIKRTPLGEFNGRLDDLLRL